MGANAQELPVARRSPSSIPTSKIATYDQLSGLRAWLRALGPSSRHIFMLAWCAIAREVYFENSTCRALTLTLSRRNRRGDRRCSPENHPLPTPSPSRHIFMLAWCPIADMTSTSKMSRQALTPRTQKFDSLSHTSRTAPRRRRMGEGAGGGTSETPTSAPLCGPKAFRLVPIEAFGVFFALHLRAAWCARTRAPANATSIPQHGP